MEKGLGRPPYLTPGVDPRLIAGDFEWVPETPAFRLYGPGSPHTLPVVKIPPREYAPGFNYDNVTRGVFDRYADFLRYRGDFYRGQGDCKNAVAAYGKSLEWGDSPEAESGLASCR
jgi:hypothetical protein